jgi:hypothetical protein
MTTVQPNYDAALNLKHNWAPRPVTDHVGYALNINDLFMEAATQPFVEHYIPGRYLNDVGKPLVMAILAAGGNQIIPGVTFDPTTDPKIEIDATGEERFLIGGAHVSRPILKIKDIKVDVDTAAFDPNVYPPLLRKLAPHIHFKGPVTLKELKIINDPITGIMIVPKLPTVEAIHQNIGKKGVVTSDIIAELLPGLLKPQERFQQFCQEMLDTTTRTNVPALPDKKVRRAIMQITGDSQAKPSNPDLCGIKFRLETKPAI